MSRGNKQVSCDSAIVQINFLTNTTLCEKEKKGMIKIHHTILSLSLHSHNVCATSPHFNLKNASSFFDLILSMTQRVF